MSRMFVFAAILVLAGFSCKKSDDARPSGTGLAGRWESWQYVLDIGDGDISWHKVAHPEQEVLDFDSSGKGTIFNNGVQAGGSYQAISDSTLSISGSAGSLQAHYRVSGDTLEIAGACYEACSTRYRRTSRD